MAATSRSDAGKPLAEIHPSLAGRCDVKIEAFDPEDSIGTLVLDDGTKVRFGATACKASYTCRACAEPFEYFKPL